MKRYTPEEKIEIIKEAQEPGQSVYSVCRKHKISKVSFYKWLATYKKSKKNRLASLSSRIRKDRNHPKSIGYLERLAILRFVHKNPSYSCHKIAKTLKLGNHAVQNLLYKEGLSTEEARQDFAKRPFWKRESADRRLGMIELYQSGWKVKDVCAHFGVSKPTFIKWRRRFLESQAKEQDPLPVLADRFVAGEAHHKTLDASREQKVLGVVRENPLFSVHKIHRQLAGVVGHHGIQNVLDRYSLNTLDKRLEYAGNVGQLPNVKTAPAYEPVIPMYKWRLLFAPFKTVPKQLVTNPRDGLLSLGFLSIPLLAIFFFLRMLATAAPGSSPVGLFFSTIALCFGLFFFIYSMKYYITILMVLRLAQSGEHTDPKQDEQAEGTEASETAGSKISKKPSMFAGLVANTVRLQRLLLGKNQTYSVNPLTVNLKNVTLSGRLPFVSIHVALYNEKRVVERLIRATTSQEWSNYEVVLTDDSTDETTTIAKQILDSEGRALKRTVYNEELEVFVSTPVRQPGIAEATGPVVKLIHRFSRAGFKGGALQKALEETDPRAEYITVFDADFVPYPDTLIQFMKSFQEVCLGLDHVKETNIAAVQGYQWHVLNKSQTWVTRGVRTEYAGSYVIERAGEEIYQGLKQISGSVYCIRADVLREFGWGSSITEDFELTLRLYEAGYKVAFTPYIQAPAEAVSTIKRLIRQRMRWAEGASFNIKVMLPRMIKSRNMTRAEKFEFFYLAPYYLQAAFFVVGTFSWFISEAILHSHLPFWSAAFGWSLVFTNLLSLPLMNIVGLFLEESDERDYVGILSFIALSYLVVPFQAYAAIKGFIEPAEGPWFRTPKTGLVTDTATRSAFGKFFGNVLGRRVNYVEVKADAGTLAISNLAFSNVFSVRDSAYNRPGSWSLGPKRRPLGLMSHLVIVILILATASISFLQYLVPITEATNPSATWYLRDQAVGSQNTATNTGTGKALYCLSQTDCRFTYRDETNNNAFYYAQCTSDPCNTQATITLLDGGTGCVLTGCSTVNSVGGWSSIYCVTSTDCKIAYFDITNNRLLFAQCTTASCATGGTRTIVDGTGCTSANITGCLTTNAVGKYVTIYCPSSTGCDMAEQDTTANSLRFVNCTAADCSTGAITIADGSTCNSTNITGCLTNKEGQAASIYCISSTDCKISYTDTQSATNGRLRFLHCTAANCSTGVISTLDGAAGCTLSGGGSPCSTTDNTGYFTSIYCISSTDCKISYKDSTVNELTFGHCTNADCSAGNRNLLDGKTGCKLTGCHTSDNTGNNTSIYCLDTTNCNISYRNVLGKDSWFGNCTDAGGDCATGTTKVIDGIAGCTLTNCNTRNDEGIFNSVFCPAASDCRVIEYDRGTAAAPAVTALNLRFATCTNADCSTGQIVTQDGNKLINNATGAVTTTQTFGTASTQTYTLVSNVGYPTGSLAGSLASGTYTLKLNFTNNITGGTLQYTYEVGYCTITTDCLTTTAQVTSATQNIISTTTSPQSPTAVAGSSLSIPTPANSNWFYIKLAVVATGTGSITINMNNTSGNSADTSITTPLITVPEKMILLTPIALFLPATVKWFKKRRDKWAMMAKRKRSW